MRASPPYTAESEIDAIGHGLLTRTLPKADWTHAAHFAAALWLLVRRPDLDAAAAMPGLIRAYNEATGVRNTEDSGYHETITQASLRAARAFLAAHEPAPLHVICNDLLASTLGDPDWLLRYWSRENLFSREARAAWLPPDIAKLPF
jgi:hypothetical protein